MINLTALAKHPKSLWVLSFGKLWDTFSYYGTQTILVLYLIHTFHYSQNSSYIIYGAYAALLSIMPVLGGYLSDRYLPPNRIFVFASILIIISNLVLMIKSYYVFSLGISMAIMGSALYRSSLMHAVGNLYEDFSHEKEEGFTWTYLATNVGGTLGPIVYGIAASSIGWNIGFLCSAIGMAISLFWYLLQKPAINTQPHQTHSSRTNLLWPYLILTIVCLIISVPFYFIHSLDKLINSAFILFMIFILFLIYKHKNRDKRRLTALFIMSFLGMFYFAAGLQIGATITIFIQQKIQQGLISFKLPASTFSMLYPLFVLILAPFVTTLWNKLNAKGIKISAYNKLAWGIFLGAFGILSFYFAATFSEILLWIIIGNMFLAAGELVLTPGIYAMIDNISPIKMRSTMMGVWLFFMGFGGYLSGAFARVTNGLHASHNNGLQFLLIAGITFIVACITQAMVPWLKKLSV